MTCALQLEPPKAAGSLPTRLPVPRKRRPVLDPVADAPMHASGWDGPRQREAKPRRGKRRLCQVFTTSAIPAPTTPAPRTAQSTQGRPKPIALAEPGQSIVRAAKRRANLCPVITLPSPSRRREGPSTPWSSRACGTPGSRPGRRPCTRCFRRARGTCST